MDKYIIGKNSTGKTRLMLEQAKKSGAIVACKNPIAMQRKADNYGIFGVEFIGYDEVNIDFVNEEKIAIDEIGEFIKYRFGMELDSFTLTVD